MHSSVQRLLILALFGVSLAGFTRGQAVTEFPIPTAGSGPAGIAAGPDGNLWFTELVANKIGRISPAGVITEFPVPTANSQPLRIAAGPDGSLWFTEKAGNQIGRITTAGVLMEFPVPTANSQLEAIAVGPDGNLWFTETVGHNIGRITPTGVATEFPVPLDAPLGIAAGPDGRLWFTTYYGKIGRISTTGVALASIVIPNDLWPNYGITAGPDGNLWFTEPGGIGRITTAGVITDFPSPNSSGGIVAGPDGSLWFTNDEGNEIGRVTTAGVITEYSIPTASSGVGGIAVGPDGNIWFTESAGNKIGRFAAGEPRSCVTDSATLCLSGGRFQVRTEWQVPSQGTSGHGRAVPLTDDTGTFWFFDANSIEVIVKVLDGCSLNGHSWVFAAGLTNVGVTLTVTDTQTDVAKTYTNPADTAFQPIQDTAAFSTCP